MSADVVWPTVPPGDGRKPRRKNRTKAEIAAAKKAKEERKQELAKSGKTRAPRESKTVKSKLTSAVARAAIRKIAAKKVHLPLGMQRDDCVKYFKKHGVTIKAPNLQS